MKATYLWMTLLSVSAAASTDIPVMRSNVNAVTLIADGKTLPGKWIILSGKDVDEFKTLAGTVTFASDVDTLTFHLKEWQSADFGIITSKGDTARVRVCRESANPFESPDPKLKTIPTSGLLNRKQVSFDIDALVYTLSEIHPNLFSECNQTDFMRAVNKAKASLPDSVSILDVYRYAAPIVAMIGDGHTSLSFPFDHVFTKELMRIPLFVHVLPQKDITCRTSLDSIIPENARILSINGHSAEEMIETMLPYISGEREHFRLSELNTMFTALFQMIYAEDQYTIRYIDKKKTREVTFPAMKWEEIIKRCTMRKKAGQTATLPYSFSIDRENSVAILDFRQCTDLYRMKQFADSLFQTLRKENIRHLIIDVRNNGGGDSRVGDVLLRYISPEPFIQMDKALIKKTPLTARLKGDPNLRPAITFIENSPENYIRPLSEEEGHFKGHIYLLTSNQTFSSASSFAWTFKMCHTGPVIGEETGGMNVSYGDYLWYRLPVSGLPCHISYKRFWQFRADEKDIHGTIPDIHVPADEALATAYKLIKKNKKIR